jgi:hypothetical protein
MLIFDGVFSDEAFEKLSQAVSDEPLLFGAVSTDWNLPIFKAEPLSDNLAAYPDQILTYLNAASGSTFELLSAHLNAQPVGCDAAWHTDDAQDGCTHAASFYCHNADWSEAMGGYLLIGDPHTGQSSAILPHKNRLVLHGADIPHCALSPNQRAGTIIRYSLTLKLKQIAN